MDTFNFISIFLESLTVSGISAVVLFLFLIPPSASRADALEEASKRYTEGNFRKALELYESAKTGENPSLAALGIAKSLYKLQRFSESKRSYLTLLEANRTPELLYNLGNTQTQVGEYKEAIESYQEALSLSPNDQEIKENLEYVKKLLQEESNSSSSSSSSSDNSSNDSSTSKQSGGGGGGQSSNDGSQSSEQSVKSSGQGSNSSSSSASNGEANNSSNSQNSSNASSSSKGAGAGSSQQSSDAKQGQDSKGQDSSQSVSEKDTRAKPSDREEMLYDTVQEDRGALRKYRQEKALEELEQRQESPPEKDW